MSQDPYSRFLAQRMVLVGGPIDDDVANVVIAQLLFLQSEGAAPIQLVLRSPGGHVGAALAIRDTMDDVAPPVHTHALADVAGMATLLLAHGARGHRTASPHAAIELSPLHVQAGARGELDEIARTWTTVTELLAADTGQPAERVRADLRAARTFRGDEACSYGLVDRIADLRLPR